MAQSALPQTPLPLGPSGGSQPQPATPGVLRGPQTLRCPDAGPTRLQQAAPATPAPAPRETTLPVPLPSPHILSHSLTRPPRCRLTAHLGARSQSDPWGCGAGAEQRRPPTGHTHHGHLHRAGLRERPITEQHKQAVPGHGPRGRQSTDPGADGAHGGALTDRQGEQGAVTGALRVSTPQRVAGRPRRPVWGSRDPGFPRRSSAPPRTQTASTGRAGTETRRPYGQRRGWGENARGAAGWPWPPRKAACSPGPGNNWKSGHLGPGPSLLATPEPNASSHPATCRQAPSLPEPMGPGGQQGSRGV